MPAIGGHGRARDTQLDGHLELWALLKSQLNADFMHRNESQATNDVVFEEAESHIAKSPTPAIGIGIGKAMSNAVRCTH